VPEQNSVPRVGRILHLSPVKRIQSYSSLLHCLCLHCLTLSNFFSFVFLHVNRRSTAFMESSQDFVGSADVHQSTCQMDMKIKIFKTKITSHIFIFFYVSELYLYIFVCVKIHCFQNSHYISCCLKIKHTGYIITICNAY